MASWFSTIKKDPYGTLNPEQVQVNKGLGGTLLNNINGANYDYNGQLAAPITAGEQNVVANNSRMNAVAQQTYGDLGNYNDQNFNTNFNSEIADPTLANFKNNVAPLLGEELPSFGTQRAQVISRALGDLQNNVMQQRFTAREAAKNRALTALSGAANYDQTAAGIQAIPREIQQAGLDKAYQSFVTSNTQKQNGLNQALQFLGISTGSAIQDPTNLGNMIALAQAGANIYGTVAGGGSKGGAPQSGGQGSGTGTVDLATKMGY